jgi:hypothetical protein
MFLKAHDNVFPILPYNKHEMNCMFLYIVL